MAGLKARVRRLDRYQKGVLLVIAAMIIVFTVIYPLIILRVGIEFRGSILVPKQIDGGTVYSGRVDGEPTSFTVNADGTVDFQCGGMAFGPYTLREAPDAVPKDMRSYGGSVAGVELFERERLVFRGAVNEAGGQYYLYEEDGSLLGPEIRITTGSGVVYDGDGRPVNRVEPDASAIIELMRGPELTHKGVWLGWFAGVIFCAATAASILFADELFRWNMSFSIRNADRAEPSDWEIMSRYIMWTVLPIVALFMFIMGLK